MSSHFCQYRLLHDEDCIGIYYKDIPSLVKDLNGSEILTAFLRYCESKARSFESLKFATLYESFYLYRNAKLNLATETFFSFRKQLFQAIKFMKAFFKSFHAVTSLNCLAIIPRKCSEVVVSLECYSIIKPLGLFSEHISLYIASSIHCFNQWDLNMRSILTPVKMKSISCRSYPSFIDNANPWLSKHHQWLSWKFLEALRMLSRLVLWISAFHRRYTSSLQTCQLQRHCLSLSPFQSFQRFQSERFTRLVETWLLVLKWEYPGEHYGMLGARKRLMETSYSSGFKIQTPGMLQSSGTSL